MIKIPCYAPWTHVHTDAGNKKRLCCIARVGVPYERHVDFWNGSYMTGIREKFLKGEVPDDCSVCYGDANREEENRYYKTFEHKFGHLDAQIRESTTSDGHTTFAPLSMDIRTSLCNLKCRTCNTDASSSLAIQANKMVGRKVINIANFKELAVDHEADIEQIVNEHTNSIYWAGGEPLMNPIYWKTIDRCIANGWTNIEMLMTTNGTVIDDEMYERLIAQTKIFTTKIFLSIDGVGVVNDYVRFGTDWNQLELVIRKLHRDIGDNLILDITLTNVTFLQLPEILAFAKDVGVKLTFKMMFESGRHVIDGTPVNNNQFLSLNLLHMATLEAMENRIAALANEVDSNIMPIITFLKSKHQPTQLTDLDRSALSKLDAVQQAKINLVEVLTNQSL